MLRVGSIVEGHTAHLEQNKHERIELISHLKGLDKSGLSALMLPVQDPELCMRLPECPPPIASLLRAISFQSFSSHLPSGRHVIQAS